MARGCAFSSCRNMRRRVDGGFAVLALTALTMAQLASTSPLYFIDLSRGFIPDGQRCIAHPAFTSAGHGTNSIDSGITFEVLNRANNARADVLCPGGEHTLIVSYGSVPRAALLNSNPPVVNFTSPEPTAGCPNQVTLGALDQATNYTTTFTVPCSAAGGSILFKTTSVGKDDYQWKYNTRTLFVADAASPEVAPGGVCAAVASTCGIVPGRTCTRSNMGYDCMATWRNVTVHWSVNSTAAPDNACTPTTKTMLQAEDLASNGALHMAVQSAATGHVALGFAVKAGKMVPSDIIMGWVGSDMVPVVGTFDATNNSRLAQNNNTGNSWAYDRGVALNASTGVTTVCFSRRYADARARTQPNLHLNGDRLAINFAVSEEDALVKHKPGSVGGFYLDLMRGVVPVSPPPPAPAPPQLASAPPPPASLETSDTISGDVGKGCIPSNLGYTCMAQRGKVTVHWSINTASAPANPCTPTTKTNLKEDQLAQYGTLHMAVQSATQGYVGLGFAENPGDMYRSDIVLGWVQDSGAGWFSTFHATENDLGMGDAVSPSWAYDTGVVRNATAGHLTTICFSRRLVDSRAKASPDLRAVVGNGSSSSSSPVGGRRRLSQSTSGAPSQQLGLIWAISPSKALVEHRGYDVGGFYLDLVSGQAQDLAGGKSKQYWINVHGALMAMAWGLLLPLGALLPAHRWILGDAKFAGKHVWFWSHMVCQWTGMALFIAGFVVAFTKLSGGSEIVEAHENIGIAIMAAAGAQVVLGYARPGLDSPHRGLWNMLHHNLGRATVLLAWANVYIGIYAYHTNWGASYAAWITPIAIVMALLVLTDIALRIVGAGRRDDPAAPAIRADVYLAKDGAGAGAAADGFTPADPKLSNKAAGF